MIRELKQDYPHFKIVAMSGGGQIDAEYLSQNGETIGR